MSSQPGQLNGINCLCIGIIYAFYFITCFLLYDYFIGERDPSMVNGFGIGLLCGFIAILGLLMHAREQTNLKQQAFDKT